MRKRSRFPETAAWLAGVTAACLVQAALAQDQPPEVVVTTGFRPEPLNASVGSTTVLDASLIESRQADHLEAVIGAAANVTMTSGASRGRFVQIRGIGDLEQFVDPKHYPSVGLRLDGIDIGGIASSAMLFDVDQVEVLRGPQGTAYGASALAGQVNIRSAAPADTFDAYLDAGVGDYSDARLGFAAGGAMSEDVSGRVAVLHHQGDGYIDNAWLGRDDTNGYDESMLRTKLHWSPTDSAAFDFTAIRFDSKNGYDAFSLDNTRTTQSDEPGQDNLDLSALGIEGTWALGSGGTIEARLNALESTVDYGYDEDWTYVGFCDGTLCDPVLDYFSNTDRYVRGRDDNSLDLRWLGEGQSDAGRSRRYVLGVYTQDRRETLAREYYGPFTSNYASDRLAIYGQAELELADRVELTLGLRRERFDDRYDDSFAFTSRSEDDLSAGQIALRFAFNDRSQFYAVVSQAMKPGAVNTEASSVMPLVQPRFQTFLASRLTVRRERLTNVELGVKTTLAGGRLALRGDLFRMSRDDAQLESWFWDPENYLWVGLLDNADGENQGAELDFDLSVSDRWRLRGSLGLMRTRVDGLTTFDLDLDDFVVRTGIDQTEAPSWQAHLDSEWTPGGDWSVTIGIDASDSHRYGYYHNATIGRSTVVDASLRRTIGASELTLWTRNLLDEDVAVHALYFGNDPRKGWIPERYLQLGEPRLLGITLRHNF